ncbi:hypothetical protein Nepgr_014759 [Nepenthes gracilis]|uniref:Uncharacterized protein n=1 Tax=Nepenthes gracilis TaxID=150966 RepID=A0AAD3SK32_NEPGR|nr:hypothetical protein Nepgr_014759 [Nepenthes gracilis]
MRIGKPWQFICPLLFVCHPVSIKDLGVKKLEDPCAQLGELVGAKDLDEAPSFRPPPADAVSLDLGYAGTVGCVQAGIFPISDQELTQLGAFDPGSEPGEIMQDGRGSLSPEFELLHGTPLVAPGFITGAVSNEDLLAGAPLLVLESNLEYRALAMLLSNWLAVVYAYGVLAGCGMLMLLEASARRWGLDVVALSYVG